MISKFGLPCVWLIFLRDLAFLASLLKDIKSERPKITDKDNLRLLYVTKWFLEFFLAARANDKGNDKRWEFGLVGEVIERGWIVWVLKRMRGAVEEKVRHRLLLQSRLHFDRLVPSIYDVFLSFRARLEMDLLGTY